MNRLMNRLMNRSNVRPMVRLGFATLVATQFLVASLLVASAPAGAAGKSKKSAAAAPAAPVVLKPFGNPNAPIGGTFNYNIQGEPTTLHPITSSDGYSQAVHALVLDTLMERSPETYDWVPALAESYSITPDGKQFTFVIRKGAKFHDGHDITADDVKFSFDAIFDDQYHAAHLRPYYEGIEKAEVVDPYTIRFTTKQKYFGNFDSIAELSILPKHIYSTEAGKKMNKSLVGSGPYKIEKYDQGQSIMLVRNAGWWGFSQPQFKGRYNFEHIRMRFIQDENVSLEMLKKGDLDLEAFGPEAFEKKAVGPEWGKTVFKARVENSSPKGYGYTGWNMRKEMFQDRNVRLALAMLCNRAEMNQKFRFGLSLLATGPWYQQSDYADPSVKPIQYDPKKAVELLKATGWSDPEKKGILSKTINGKRVEFRFTVTHGWKDGEKYLVLYQQDLKKVGIDMQIQLLEWNAMMKNIDENNFDALSMAWGAGGVDVDPKQVWHSSSAVKGGSNHIGFKNDEVDRLIDEARAELDKKKRIPLMRKVYKTIADAAPYVFMFNDRYTLYGHSSNVVLPKLTFKYEIGWTYWWSAKAK